MSDAKIKSDFNPSNYGNLGANRSDKPIQTKKLTGDIPIGVQNLNSPTSAVEKKGYDNSASLKFKLLNNRQPAIADKTIKTSAPGEDDRVFKTTGGAWRLKDSETTNNPEFYRDGADTAGTTLFDKRFYRHEGKWIELNGRGRFSDLPENKGKPRPADVSEFDWQGWREASAAEIPADYSAEEKTVAFTDTKQAENQKSLFKRYVVDQNLVGDWDEVSGERMIDAAIQKGAKIEAVSTGELNGNGKTVFAVKMNDESLAILRGELNDYQNALQKGAQAQEKGRAEVNNLAKDSGGLLYETGRKIVDAAINVVPDALNLVLFPDFSTHTKDEPSFGRAKVGEMYDELSSQIDPNYAGNPIPRIETAAVKYDFRSEMMRRDINGKLDGDGTKAGDAITTTASIIAPIVAGKVIIPETAPQSLKTLGGLPEATKALSIPQGLSEAQFTEFSQTIRKSKAAEYGTDIRVHGSRAAGTAKETSDIDVAIRVPKEKFEQILKEIFTKAKPGNAVERTMQHAIKTGKIRRTDLELSDLGKQLAEKFRLSKVDISVVKQDGAFDQGPWIPLNNSVPGSK